MRSFAVKRAQLGRIIAALIAEELGRLGLRTIATLTAAAWNSETALGAALSEGGMALSDKERVVSAKRVNHFFGVDALAVDGAGTPAGDVVGDWVSAVEKAIRHEFTDVSFAAAGHNIERGGTTHAADIIYQHSASAANLFIGRRRLISLVAPHSLMGFALTVLAPNLQDIPALDVREKTPEELGDLLEFGDLIVGTPTLWRYMISEGVTAPNNAMGMSFGEPMTPELSTDMRKAGFAAQREIYGSTENGLIGWRDDPTDPFILFDHWRRDGDGLRSAGDPSRDAIQPMDVMEWSGERRFLLAGRRDGAIQIGAVNVFPKRTEDVLRDHELVTDCIVRVGASDSSVNRLIAHIVLDSAATPSEAVVRKIDHWCRDQLRPQERPRIFHFEETLDPLRTEN